MPQTSSEKPTKPGKENKEPIEEKRKGTRKKRLRKKWIY